MDTVAERLEALFKRYPHLADGEHDKELIAKYLEVYHNHLIPIEVLNQIPSFETIRRTRQYYTKEQGAVVSMETERESRLQYEAGVKRLKDLISARGFEVSQEASPRLKKLLDLEPTAYGTKGDIFLPGLVCSLPDLVSDQALLTKVFTFLIQIQQYPKLDRQPIIVLTGDGDVTPEWDAVVDKLKFRGACVDFAS